MYKRLAFYFLSVIFIVSLALAVILYGRGYRYNPQDKAVNPTGILSVSSFPEKASIYVNDKLTSATNASITLSPDWYNIRIQKDGYQSWEKRIRIQGEVVSQIDALLIPNNPSLRAITTSGVVNPTLSPSSSRVAYFVNTDDTDPVSLKTKNGLWVLELKSGTLGNKPDPKQVFIADQNYNFSQSKIYWSPDEKEIIISFLQEGSEEETPYLAWLINLDNALKEPPVDVTLRQSTILANWQIEFNEDKNTKLANLPVKLVSTLTSNTKDLKFSPDDTKILYQATSSAQLEQIITPALIGTNPTQESRTLESDKYYVYDLKEDKNFYIKDVQKPPQEDTPPVWYTDSKHLILVDKEAINMVDYDGTNKRSIYTGPFSENLAFPWTSGEKIAILTNFNKQGSLVDFYEVDLR